MIRGLLLALVLVIAGGIPAGCSWLKFAVNGPEFYTSHTTISVSDTRPPAGEEIEVWATHRRQPAAAEPADEREARFFLIEAPLPSYSFTASGGTFRIAEGEINHPGAAYEGGQIVSLLGHVYWRAPAEPGKHIIRVEAGLDAADVRIWVQPAAGSQT